MASNSIAEIRRVNEGRYKAFLLQAVRPAGEILAWGALRLRIKPLQVTYANFALGIWACLLLAWGDPQYRPVAAAALVLWQAMDITDGTMARVLRRRDNYGGFVDYAGGMFLLAFLQISIGVGLFRYPEGFIGQPYPLILGAYSSVAAILARVIHKIAETRFGQAVVGTDNTGARGKLSGLAGLVMHVEGIGAFQIPFIILGILLRCLELVAAFYFLVNMLVLLGLTAKLLVTLRHHHEYL